MSSPIPPLNTRTAPESDGSSVLSLAARVRRAGSSQPAVNFDVASAHPGGARPPAAWLGHGSGATDQPERREPVKHAPDKPDKHAPDELLPEACDPGAMTALPPPMAPLPPQHCSLQAGRLAGLMRGVQTAGSVSSEGPAQGKLSAAGFKLPALTHLQVPPGTGDRSGAGSAGTATTGYAAGQLQVAPAPAPAGRLDVVVAAAQAPTALSGMAEQGPAALVQAPTAMSGMAAEQRPAALAQAPTALSGMAEQGPAALVQAPTALSGMAEQGQAAPVQAATTKPGVAGQFPAAATSPGDKASMQSEAEPSMTASKRRQSTSAGDAKALPLQAPSLQDEHATSTVKPPLMPASQQHSLYPATTQHALPPDTSTHITVPFVSQGPGHQVTASWGGQLAGLQLRSTSEQSHRAVVAALDAGLLPGRDHAVVDALFDDGDEHPHQRSSPPEADEEDA